MIKKFLSVFVFLLLIGFGSASYSWTSSATDMTNFEIRTNAFACSDDGLSWIGDGITVSTTDGILGGCNATHLGIILGEEYEGDSVGGVGICCPEGAHCILNSSNYVCMFEETIPPVGCDDDSDCTAEEVCVEGECVPRVSSQGCGAFTTEESCESISVYPNSPLRNYFYNQFFSDNSQALTIQNIGNVNELNDFCNPNKNLKVTLGGQCLLVGSQGCHCVWDEINEICKDEIRSGECVVTVPECGDDRPCSESLVCVDGKCVAGPGPDVFACRTSVTSENKCDSHQKYIVSVSAQGYKNNNPISLSWCNDRTYEVTCLRRENVPFFGVIGFILAGITIFLTYLFFVKKN